MKKQYLFLLSLLLILPIFLTACSNKSTKNSVPSAKTILTSSSNTKITSLQATWLQTNQHQQIQQKAVVDYQKDPFIIHINSQASSNSYKMWVNKNNTYIQDPGTASNRWFKTQQSDNASFKMLTDALNSSTLITFGNSVNSFFKVQQTANGYKLTYDGKDQKMWDQIVANTILTTIVGVDQKSVKPEKIHIQILTNKNYKLKKINIDTRYKEDGKTKNLKLVINQINQLPEMQIPSNVTNGAIDLTDSKN